MDNCPIVGTRLPNRCLLVNLNFWASLILGKTNYHQQSGLLLGLILKLIGKNPEQAVKTYVYLASSSEVEAVSGRFFTAGKEVVIKRQALDDAVATKLWEVSAKAVGLG